MRSEQNDVKKGGFLSRNRKQLSEIFSKDLATLNASEIKLLEGCTRKLRIKSKPKREVIGGALHFALRRLYKSDKKDDAVFYINLFKLLIQFKPKLIEESFLKGINILEYIFCILGLINNSSHGKTNESNLKILTALVIVLRHDLSILNLVNDSDEIKEKLKPIVAKSLQNDNAQEKAALLYKAILAAIVLGSDLFGMQTMYDKLHFAMQSGRMLCFDCKDINPRKSIKEKLAGNALATTTLGGIHDRIIAVGKFIAFLKQFPTYNAFQIDTQNVCKYVSKIDTPKYKGFIHSFIKLSSHYNRYFSDTDLFFAISLKCMIRYGYNVPHCTKAKHSLLTLAIKLNELEILKALFHTGAVALIDATTSLCCAIDKKNFAMFKFLVEELNINPNYASNSRSKTTLYVAASKGSVEILKYLLSRYAYYINLPIAFSTYNPLEAALKNKHLECASALLKAGSSTINSIGTNSAVNYAIEVGNFDFVFLYIDKGWSHHEYITHANLIKLLSFCIENDDSRIFALKPNISMQYKHWIHSYIPPYIICSNNPHLEVISHSTACEYQERFGPGWRLDVMLDTCNIFSFNALLTSRAKRYGIICLGSFPIIHCNVFDYNLTKQSLAYDINMQNNEISLVEIYQHVLQATYNLAHHETNDLNLAWNTEESCNRHHLLYFEVTANNAAVVQRLTKINPHCLCNSGQHPPVVHHYEIVNAKNISTLAIFHLSYTPNSHHKEIS